MDLGLTYFFKINSVKMKKKKFQSMESKYRSRHFTELYVLLNPFKNSELKFFFHLAISVHSSKPVCLPNI